MKKRGFMEIREKIKNRVKKYLSSRQILPTEMSLVPLEFQRIILEGHFDNCFLDELLFELIDDEQTLIELIGGELFYSEECKGYLESLTRLKEFVNPKKRLYN